MLLVLKRHNNIVVEKGIYREKEVLSFMAGPLSIFREKNKPYDRSHAGKYQLIGGGFLVALNDFSNCKLQKDIALE